jgi:hypothetical protein
LWSLLPSLITIWVRWELLSVFNPIILFFYS